MTETPEQTAERFVAAWSRKALASDATDWSVYNLSQAYPDVPWMVCRDLINQAVAARREREASADEAFHAAMLARSRS